MEANETPAIETEVLPVPDVTPSKDELRESFLKRNLAECDGLLAQLEAQHKQQVAALSATEADYKRVSDRKREIEGLL